MTMLCEPSSQVYLSRPMTKSLPTASSSGHRPSYSSSPGLTFLHSTLLLPETRSFPCLQTQGHRQERDRGTWIPLPPRLKGVSWSPLIHY